MKRKHYSRFISLILAILTLTTLLIGCDRSTQDPAETTDPIEDTSVSDTAADTTAAERIITVNGVPITEYRIVYYKSVYAGEAARNLREAIKKETGKMLPISSDASAETEYEILIGKTSRTESAEVRADYDRPNVYYDVKVSGSKLVVMGEGYSVLKHAVEELTAFLGSLTVENCALEGSLLSGDIKDKIDTLKISVVNRTDGTSLRVLHWNMAAPYLDPNVTPPPVVYTSNVTRGEVMADIILQMLPDIISTNEFYESHNGNHDLFNAVMGELGEYYTCLDSPYDKDKPEKGADVIKDKTINSNIIYRKASGLEVVSSAWRYSSEKTSTSAANPGGWVYYHGSHTAVFKLGDQKFIYSTAHYADSRSSSKWAKEQLAAIADAQTACGNGTILPVILTGDLYTGYTSSSPDSGYKYIVAQGYTDSQRKALVNANKNISHGTFHTIGERQTNRISEDFVFCKGNLTPLCFKVLTSTLIDDTSDHYPVLADLEFD